MQCAVCSVWYAIYIVCSVQCEVCNICSVCKICSVCEICSVCNICSVQCLMNGDRMWPAAATHPPLSDDDVDANFDNYFCRLWLFSQIMKISSSNPPTSLWWRCGLMCLQKLDLEYCNPSSCNPHTSLMEMWIGDGCKILQLTSLMEMVLNDASMKHCYAPNFYNDYRTCNQVRFPNPLFPGGDPVNCNPASSLETMIARIVDDLCTQFWQSFSQLNQL